MANEALGLEITELRLGLPGSGKKRISPESEGKNGREAKSQVVGWPPVCSYRRKNSFEQENPKSTYVKVCVDGAPFLRKIDLGMYKGYEDLAAALEDLFGFSGIGKERERREYVPIYEDKDGDWMLAGDVPWEMFIGTCKRLRLMKISDAEAFESQPRD
ncbi:PREDICTED: auxin-induced protein 22C [Tarenaya hassleriana]|uniref:auxin-induced protein 22C n=1 Tax=Tarenaya hassleriana TaxID=28532 RepID=UPI00053C1786|nr:PREDICTED: auxin-induced protein 22C [Tarenaya hassleriana]